MHGNGGAHGAPVAGAARVLSLSAYLQRLVWWSMLPLLAVAVYLGVDSVQQIHAANDRAAARLASEIARDLDQFLQARMDALDALSRSPLLDDPQRLADFQRAAQSVQRTFGNVVILADVHGQMLVHSGREPGSPLPRLPQPAGRSALQRALDSGRPAAGDSFTGPLNGQDLVAIAVPLAAPRPGSPPGRALLMTIDIRQLQQLVDRVPLPEGWSVQVRDSLQKLLAERPPASAASAAALADADLRRTLSSTLAPWSIVLATSAQSRTAPLWRAVQVLGLAIAGATLTGWLAGGLASRRLARAVAALADDSPGQAATEPIREIAAARQRLADSQQQRAAADAEMRASEATFRAVFMGMRDAAALTDSQRRIQLVNPTFEAQFGLPAVAVLGRTTAILYADDAAVGQRLQQRDLRDGPAVYEMQYRRQDGSVFRCWAGAWPSCWTPTTTGKCCRMRRPHCRASARRSCTPGSGPTATRCSS